MKKFLYTLLFIAFSGIAMTSCTEDDITPSAQAPSNGGGQGTGDNLSGHKKP